MLSQKQYEEKKKQLEEKTEKISHLDTALEGLKEHQKSKDDVIEELREAREGVREFRGCFVVHVGWFAVYLRAIER